MPDEELGDYITALYIQVAGEGTMVYPAIDCLDLDFMKESQEEDKLQVEGMMCPDFTGYSSSSFTLQNSLRGDLN